MQLELNRRSKVPMYRQLAAELREQIVSGAMAEGYRLPPERELSSRLEVNRTTVLQAYQQLKDEGLIASKVGKGTFVLPAASASRTSHTSNSDFGNAITRTTRSSAEMGTSQASSSGDVERATSTDFLTTDQGSSSAAVHTIRESRSVQGPEPTVVRPPWSVLFSDYSNRFTYHDIASAERAQRGDTIIDFATGSPNPADIPDDLLRKVSIEAFESREFDGQPESPIEGFEELRALLAEHMRARGVQCGVRNVMVLSGSEQGIDLIVRAFIQPRRLRAGRTIHVLPGIADLPFGGCAHHRRSSGRARYAYRPVGWVLRAIPAQAHLHRPDVPKPYRYHAVARTTQRTH